MTVTVAMYDRTFEHMGPRLNALALDIKVQTFSKDGRYRIDGKSVAPADAAIDYNIQLLSHYDNALNAVNNEWMKYGQ